VRLLPPRSELIRAQTGAAVVRWIVVLGGSAQALGMALFFWAMWSRIRARRESRPDGEGDRYPSLFADPIGTLYS
jgi:hypothetical protein